MGRARRHNVASFVMEAVLISRNYLLKRPSPPSAVKVMVDQSVIPAMIDAAAAVEMQFERIAVVARRAPLIGVAVAFGAGLLASRIVRRWR
jgi:hypothetical protein